MWSKGVHYRKNYKGLPGRPDIVITKYKIAVFCDSEFFHGKDWEIQKHKVEKGANADYWVRKITRNMERDRQKDQELKKMGWQVIHFWSKDILNDVSACYRNIQSIIDSADNG